MYEARFDVLNEPSTNGEDYVQNVVLKHAPMPVVFDVGANIGDWTASILGKHNSVSVHAFEPSSETFSVLHQRNIESTSVTLVRKACSDHVGDSCLIVHGPTWGTNSLAPKESRLGGGVTTEAVALTTIDVYCDENDIQRINLLKVDAEGHDMAVMLGANKMLRSGSVDVIQFEYNHCWIEERRLLRDAFDYLKPLGYEIGKISGNVIQFYPDWHVELETNCEANYIACVPEWGRFFRSVSPGWVPYSSQP
jgi:FkbM family methyltransferase